MKDQKPARPKVLFGFSLACAAAAILCLVAGFIFLVLVHRPWAMGVSEALLGLFTVFAFGYYMFKLLILLWGRSK
jgi:type IV secretory pathway VirB3-like protein